TPVPFWRKGDPADSPRQTTQPAIVSDDYFRSLDIPLLFGRNFTDLDRLDGHLVAIVDSEMTRRNWSSPAAAVGERITLGAAKRSYEIVGVVGFFGGYWARDPIPMIYLPQRQHPSVGGTVILRSSSALPNVAERARELLTRMPVRSHMSSATTLQAAWQAT